MISSEKQPPEALRLRILLCIHVFPPLTNLIKNPVVLGWNSELPLEGLCLDDRMALLHFGSLNLSVVLFHPPAKFINYLTGLGVCCLGLVFSFFSLKSTIPMKVTRMSVVWNVFMKSNGWAYLGGGNGL